MDTTGRFLLYACQYSWEGFNSIPEQLNQCQRLAQRNDLAEYDTELVFTDNKVGKVNLAQRQAGMLILVNAEPGDVILMSHYNRGFLSLRDAARLGKSLVERGVVLMDVKGPTAWDSVLRLVDGPWGTRTAEQQKPAPIGWRVAKDSQGGYKYEPDPRERKCGEWFHELSTTRGLSHQRIAALINQCAEEASNYTIRDFVHPRTGGRWAVETVRQYLSAHRTGYPLAGKTLAQIAAREAMAQRGLVTAEATE